MTCLARYARRGGLGVLSTVASKPSSPQGLFVLSNTLRNGSSNLHKTNTKLGQSTRGYSTITESGSRVSWVFTGLILLGVGATSYGLYDFYSTFTTWPKELRSDLRSAVKADMQGDYKISEAYFRSPVLTPEQLGGQYHLKISGIAIALAAVLEKQNDLRGANEVIHAHLRISFELLLPLLLHQFFQDRNLGEIAAKFGQLEEEEKYLVFGTEEILRMMKEASGASPSPGNENVNEGGPQQDLVLPSWVSHTDAGAVLERLAEFYSRTGRSDYAVPLYLQAISILLPPPKSRFKLLPFPKGQHRTSDSVGEKGISGGPEGSRRNYPSSSKKTDSSPDDPLTTCESVLAVLMYNLGMLSEKKDDVAGAKVLFKQALDQSKIAGFEEGEIEAQKAIARTSKS
ncbi:TPR-2 domain-containing protein [Rhizoctonia solani]|uniref:TPR-2 domain-containing protein n=1 Tax=Rhizoctonia solani TaxID=456999 RepID=A0A8H8NUW1_9AGAM|nr:TPR-2 domain-containing protein [Rhizoctonia solani]QRW18758.1 TPR-2 domain-containing protein [Rhizoctonia solani]